MKNCRNFGVCILGVIIGAFSGAYPKNLVQPAALPNCRNSCYMNATLQALYNVKPLTDFLLQGANPYAPNSLPYAYVELIRAFKKNHTTKFSCTANPLKLVHTRTLALMGSACAQEDATEYLTRLLDALIERGTPRTKEQINQIFGISIRTHITCPQGYESNSNEPVAVYLPITIATYNHNFRDDLQAYFAPELLEEYRPENSAVSYSYTCSKQFQITGLPQMLIVGLNRYDANRNKINAKVVMPAVLDLAPYMVNQSDQGVYQLIAAVVHGDGAGVGHYWAYVYHVDSNKWYKCNDAVITPVNEAAVLQAAQDGYAFIYQQVRVPVSKPVVQPLPVKQPVAQFEQQKMQLFMQQLQRLTQRLKIVQKRLPSAFATVPESAIDQVIRVLKSLEEEAVHVPSVQEVAAAMPADVIQELQMAAQKAGMQLADLIALVTAAQEEKKTVPEIIALIRAKSAELEKNAASVVPPVTEKPGVPLPPALPIPSKPETVKAPMIVQPLTADEIVALSPEQKKQSDLFLIAQFIPFEQSGDKDFTQVRYFARQFASQKAYNAGFRFSRPLNELVVQIQDFLKDIQNKVAQGGNIVPDLERYKISLIALFQPWVLGSFDAFSKEFDAIAENMIINSAVQLRMPIKSPISPVSPGATASDNLFRNALSSADSIVQAVRNLNRLRVDTRYLKWSALNEDVQAMHKKKNKGAAPASKQALMEELRVRATGATGGIMQLLQNPKTTGADFSKDYLKRYMFIPGFDQGLVRKIVELVQAYKPVRAAQSSAAAKAKAFADFVHERLTHVHSINGVVFVMRQFFDKDYSQPLPIQFVQDGKRQTTYVTVTPVDKQFIADFKTKLSNPLWKKDQQMQEAIDQVKTIGSLAGTPLSQDSITTLDRLLVEYKQNLKFESDLIHALKDAPSSAALYNALQQFAPNQYVNGLKTLLISLDRTPQELFEYVNLVLHREVIPKKRAQEIIEPYGSIMRLCNSFVKQASTTNDFNTLRDLHTDLVTALEELNSKGAIVQAAVSGELKSFINSSGENYRGLLSKLIDALRTGLVKDSIQYLSVFVRNAQLPEIMEKYAPFAQLLEQQLRRVLFVQLLHLITALNQGEYHAIFGLLLDDQDHRERNIEVYDRMTNKFDAVINALIALINQQEVTTVQIDALKKLLIAVQRQINGEIEVRFKERGNHEIIAALTAFFNAIALQLDNALVSGAACPVSLNAPQASAPEMSGAANELLALQLAQRRKHLEENGEEELEEELAQPKVVAPQPSAVPVVTPPVAPLKHAESLGSLLEQIRRQGQSGLRPCRGGPSAGGTVSASASEICSPGQALAAGFAALEGRLPQSEEEEVSDSDSEWELVD